MSRGITLPIMQFLRGRGQGGAVVWCCGVAMLLYYSTYSLNYIRRV